MTQFKFKRTGDADYPRHLKILLQGPPKSGKTTFISTAPNVVVAAVEAGLMSIAHLDIPYVEIDATEKLQTLHLVLQDDTLRAQAAKNMGLPQIETVAIDTLDAWQEMLKKEIMKENKRTQMQQADWGTLKERMSAILKAFVALPVNVIFTVHTTTNTDDEGRMIMTPNLQGSIKDDIAGFVDFSLLAYRQRDVDPTTAQAKISYYLKNEGDLKNPTLGNRAAGRVPEISAPLFTTLHDAVFKGFVRNDPSQQPTEVTMDVPAERAVPMASHRNTPPASEMVTAPLPDTAGAKVEPPAAPVPTPVGAGVAQQPAPDVPVPAPSGKPAEDNDQPLNAAGIGMLTKQYLAQGLVLPDDISTWSMGKGRLIARWFQACKLDAAEGKDVPRSDIVEYLKAQGAFAGEIPGVQTGVSSVVAPPKPPIEPIEEVESTTPTVEEASTPTTPAQPEAPVAEASAPTEAEAVALLTQELGAEPIPENGVVISGSAKEGDKCAECGEVVTDLDIAQLALTRFKRVLCFEDYKAEAEGKARVGSPT